MSLFRIGNRVIAFTEGGPMTWLIGSPPPTTTNYVTLQGRDIYTAAGQRVVPRGPEMVVSSLAAVNDIDTIADLGANGIRLLLTLNATNGTTPELFRQVLDRVVARGMIAWVSLYVWDDSSNFTIGSSFGGGNFFNLIAPPGTGVCDPATPGACYLSVWDRQWLKDMMYDYRGNVIIDASQEFIDPSNPETSAGRLAWRNSAINHVEFFRAAGYQNPLEIMSNYEGRDLYAIVEHASSILAADTRIVAGQPQIIFGWQAYWSPVWAPDFYPTYQGSLFLGEGQQLTAVQALNTILPTLSYPIQVGFDNYEGDTANDYAIQMEAAADQQIPWLWWAWAGDGVEGPLAFAQGGSTGLQTLRDYVENSPNGFAGARTFSGGSSGNPVGAKIVDTYAYLNSLHNHDAGLGNLNTSTANWVARMATVAPNGGNTYTCGWMFGFANAWTTPPASQGQEVATSPHIVGGTWTGCNLVEVVEFVPDNFDGPTFDPSSTNNLGFAYTQRLLEIIDAWETNAPNANRSYVIYAGWPAMDAYGDPATLTPTQAANYQAYALGAYQTWLQTLLSQLQAALPSLNIRLNNVSRAVITTWRDTAVSTIPATALFEDNAPHGTATWYFLAGIAEYMELFNEKPPSNFVINPAWGVHQTVVDNYQTIVNFMWTVLNP